MGSERRRLGDFEIVREIGREGMGVVYEAVQLSLNRPVALKVLPPLRRMNPGIPKDLETICAKAIEKDPNRRYDSAIVFAHDLHCFLEGFPILARPVGPLGRVYRRAMRRKALTAALAGALLALIVGIYFGVQLYRASSQRAEAEQQTEAEREAAMTKLKDLGLFDWFI